MKLREISLKLQAGKAKDVNILCSRPSMKAFRRSID